MNIIISICNKSAILEVFLIVKTIFKLLCFLAPFIIVIVSSIGLFKIVMNGKEDDLKEYGSVFVKRIIAGIIIFFIPTIIAYTINNLLGATNIDFIACFESASKEKVASLKAQEEAKAEAERKLQEQEDEKILKEAWEADQKLKESKKESFEEWKKTHVVGSAKLNYSKAIDIPSSVLSNASNSNPSIVITGEDGTVLAKRLPDTLREGGSTTKVFTGYAAIKLLDLNNDYVYGSSYVTNFVGQYNNHTLASDQKITVSQAATRGFPGSSNSAAEAIAVAIGKKYNNLSSDKEAHTAGVKKINEFIKTIGCSESNLGNGSGLDFSPAGHMRFSKDGMPSSSEGHTANDLSVVTIVAMKDKDFLASYSSNTNKGYAELANNRDKDGLFFIKSGTGYQCHGIWGFNYSGKRYYIAILGINCNAGDDKYKVVNSLYNWSKNSLIK